MKKNYFAFPIVIIFFVAGFFLLISPDKKLSQSINILYHFYDISLGWVKGTDINLIVWMFYQRSVHHGSGYWKVR